MTSQPLETIPEAPTPTPTPAPARVTADPPKTKPAKNPGRVASGKRLAERNRLAREAKKKAEAEAMYYFNKAALGTLFVVNRAIGKAIGRILLPLPLEHTCNDADREHYSCYGCDKEKPKYTSPCLTTSS